MNSRTYVLPCSYDELKSMYCDQLMSQKQIAEYFGTYLKRIQTAMRQFGIAPRRSSFSAFVHGHANFQGKGMSRTYRSWKQMIQRCTNPKTFAYEDYGGRGIAVDPSWRDFRNFLRDMGERTSVEITLDRFPNKDGNYEPGNCRWATKKEQRANQGAYRHPKRFTVCRICGKKAEARKLCPMHYGQAKSLGDFLAPAEEILSHSIRAKFPIYPSGPCSTQKQGAKLRRELYGARGNFSR